MANEVVHFRSVGATSVAGILGGVATAAGVPWILLRYGQPLGHAVQTGLVIGAVALGGCVELVSAFFGLVLPSQVGSHYGPDPDPAPPATKG